MLEEAQPLPDDIAALKAMVLVSRAELRTLKVIASNRLTVIGTCSFPVEVRKRPAGFRRLRLCRPPAPESRRPETPARVKCPGQRSARRLRRRPRGRFDRLLPLRHGF